MKVYVLGGFLGAGKTTLARALARRLHADGERVALITNDQGRSSVDTALCRNECAEIREIGGGCFCCRYDELESALLRVAEAGATTAIAEAVGSCTDLVATVLAPLADRQPAQFDLASLAIVVDAWRVQEIDAGAFSDDVAYLFRKQVEEADVVLLTRFDLDPPDVLAQIHTIRADATVIAVSGMNGHGLDRWLSTVAARRAVPLLLDYDRYAAAESLLGWSNARVRIRSRDGFSPAEVEWEEFACFQPAPEAVRPR
jgi:G3E family GTPase